MLSDNIKLWLKGLIVACPFDKPLGNCPIYHIRKLQLIERLRIIDNMPIEEIEKIINHHKECFEKRELHEGVKLPESSKKNSGS